MIPDRTLKIAGALNLVGMLLVASALVRLTPVTLTLSVGVGGMLLFASWGLFALVVVGDLRNRRIL